MVVIACLLGGCTERKPLDTDGESETSSSGPGSGSDATGEPTSGGPVTAGTTGGMVSTGSTSGEVSTATTVGPFTTSGTTGDDVGPMPSGNFLLAVSTVIAPDLPLQFLAEQNVTDEGGEPTLWLTLQPLAIAQGQVTQPRTPVGELSDFPGVPVTNGSFEVEAVSMGVPGAANPISGSDLVASLVLRGTFISEDFYCGEVDGEVTVPLMAPLAGSTFAAVRIADPMTLPLDVTINCAGDTVTDM